MSADGSIHGEHPFETPPAERDPARRLRGRLASPVTIVTSGPHDDPTGLTISSIIVAEGEPPVVSFLVTDTVELFYAIAATARFVVHICDESHRVLADQFAGLRPAPGGVFAGHSVTSTEFGPVLDEVESRAFCTYLDAREAGYAMLISGRVDRVDLHDLTEPLTYFRGRYRRLHAPD